MKRLMALDGSVPDPQKVKPVNGLREFKEMDCTISTTVGDDNMYLAQRDSLEDFDSKLHLMHLSSNLAQHNSFVQNSKDDMDLPVSEYLSQAYHTIHDNDSSEGEMLKRSLANFKEWNDSDGSSDHQSFTENFQGKRSLEECHYGLSSNPDGISMNLEQTKAPEVSDQSNSKDTPNCFNSGPRDASLNAGEKIMDYTFTPDIPEEILSSLPIKDQDVLQEVVRAFNASFNKPLSEELTANPDYTSLFNMGQLSIKRMIKMAKHLNGFLHLRQHDQVALLKSNAIDVMILRSSKSFDNFKENWVIKRQGIIQTVSPQSLNETSQATAEYFKKYVNAVTSMRKLTVGDDMILMLIIVVALFTVDEVGTLEDESKVNEMKCLYRATLQSYWSVRYSSPFDILPELDSLLEMLKKEMGNVQSLILSANVDDLEPLIKEIFNVHSPP